MFYAEYKKNRKYNETGFFDTIEELFEYLKKNRIRTFRIVTTRECDL
jgi:hypothetical protein